MKHTFLIPLIAAALCGTGLNPVYAGGTLSD